MKVKIPLVATDISLLLVLNASVNVHTTNHNYCQFTPYKTHTKKKKKTQTNLTSLQKIKSKSKWNKHIFTHIRSPNANQNQRTMRQ